MPRPGTILDGRARPLQGSFRRVDVMPRPGTTKMLVLYINRLFTCCVLQKTHMANPSLFTHLLFFNKILILMPPVDICIYIL